MRLGIDKWIAGYYAYQARSQYKRHRYSLCLHYMHALSRWDDDFLSKPMFAGYMAICHYELKHWDNIITEVESALFLLRRHANENAEAEYLWQDLKKHLTDLRYVKSNNVPLKKAGGI